MVIIGALVGEGVVFNIVGLFIWVDISGLDIFERDFSLIFCGVGCIFLEKSFGETLVSIGIFICGKGYFGL